MIPSYYLIAFLAVGGGWISGPFSSIKECIRHATESPDMYVAKAPAGHWLCVLGISADEVIKQK